jgi:hypothetical protein
MADRRQAVRREPIIVEVRGKEYAAHPLDWIAAGGLGNEVIQQNTNAVNNAVRQYMDGEIPQLQMALRRKMEDWDTFLRIGYPEAEKGEFEHYDLDECFELGKATLEINHLEYLIELIDPNSPPPTVNGGTETSAEGDGQKIESTPSSSSSDSVPTTPET